MTEHTDATELRIAVSRARKAVAIVDVLRRHGATVTQATEIGTSEAARAQVGELAGINTPSPISWAMAMVLLAATQAEPAAPFCRWAADPFHTCRTSYGAPIHDGQECFSETSAQIAEQGAVVNAAEAALRTADFEGGGAVNEIYTDRQRTEIDAFVAKLPALTRDELIEATKQYIWLSAYAANNPRSAYHPMCDATNDEWWRREEPEGYSAAHKAVMKTEGYS